MHRPWLFTAILTASLFLPGGAGAACTLDRLWVDSPHAADRDIACEGAKRVLSFLERLGLGSEGPVRVRFGSGGLPDVLASEGAPFTGVPLSGYYDARSGCVWVETSRVPAEDRARAFGRFPMTREWLTSLVAHEVTHQLHHRTCSARGHAVERSASEYLAYVVQIGTLGEPERAALLRLWPGVVLPSRQGANALLWLHDPPRFGVMAYRFHRQDPQLFRDLWEGRPAASDQYIPPY